jgi:hypothetical protein
MVPSMIVQAFPPLWSGVASMTVAWRGGEALVASLVVALGVGVLSVAVAAVRAAGIRRRRLRIRVAPLRPQSGCTSA